MEIGRGVQYRVIDTNDGRVRKIPLTQEESRTVVTSWYAPQLVPEKSKSPEISLDAVLRILHNLLSMLLKR
jgi:hypothetical protein